MNSVYYRDCASDECQSKNRCDCRYIVYIAFVARCALFPCLWDLSVSMIILFSVIIPMEFSVVNVCVLLVIARLMDSMNSVSFCMTFICVSPKGGLIGLCIDHFNPCVYMTGHSCTRGD